MESLINSLTEKAPEIVMFIAVLFFIGYIIHIYHNFRKEAIEQIDESVKSQIGVIMSDIEIKRATISKRIEEQRDDLSNVEDMIKSFNESIDSKEKHIDEIYKEANRKLERLNEAIPDVTEYSAKDFLGLAQRKPPQEKAAICKKILEHEDAYATELEAAGDMMRHDNRYTLALKLYQKAHDKDEERISPHIELLCLTAELDYKKRDEALEEAKKLVLDNPTRNGFARLANAWIELDRYEDIIKFSDNFLKEIEKKNNSNKLKAIALRNKAVALKSLGYIEEASKVYAKAFEISPEDENTIKGYVNLLKDLGNNEKRINLIKKLLKKDPLDPTYHKLYIETLLEQGDVRDAKNWYQNNIEKLILSETQRATFYELERKIDLVESIGELLSNTPQQQS